MGLVFICVGFLSFDCVLGCDWFYFWCFVMVYS